GLVVALVLVFFAPYAKYIPNPCLAGVILVTAYNLIDKKEIMKVVKVGKFKSDSIAMWVTCFVTILMPNLDYAIYTGIALSIALYLRDTNRVSVKVLIPLEERNSQIIEQEIEFVKEKVDVLIIQLEGNLYFGSASDLEERLDNLVNKSRVFILRMKYVSTVDLTSLNALKVFIRSVRETGGVIIFSGVRPELDSILKNANLYSEIGIENIFMSENEILACSTNDLERARTIINCQITDNADKSAACRLIDAISTFKCANNKL
ncbi:STAS domain-containing protein, partial [Desulfosporosinus sp. OT]|uniref:SulP family inorganic anion transporter n=1 Tax=Desulfosporosinus sp. OT TaxID=913865 RepID=UPI000223AC9D